MLYGSYVTFTIPLISNKMAKEQKKKRRNAKPKINKNEVFLFCVVNQMKCI